MARGYSGSSFQALAIPAPLWQSDGWVLGDRLMVGLQILTLPIGVRVPVSQPKLLPPASW